MSKIRLDLGALSVETFEASTALAAASKPSLRYSECDSCGIACTAIDCGTQYTDCGSCGIACTAIDCVSANYTDCGSCGIACTAIDCK